MGNEVYVTSRIGGDSKMNEKYEEVRAKGKELFKLKKYSEAIEHYTNSLSFFQENVQVAILLNNRALCYQNLSNYQMSLKDGIEAYERDPCNTKSLYIIGKSYELLQEYDKSLQAYSHLLISDPNSKDAQTSIERVKKHISIQHPPSAVPKGRRIAPVVFGNVEPLKEDEGITQKSRARAASEISDMLYPSPHTAPKLHPVVNVAIASINDYSRTLPFPDETQEIEERMGLQIDTSSLPNKTGLPPLSKQVFDIASILNQDYLSWSNESRKRRDGYILPFQWWQNWIVSYTLQSPTSTPLYPSLLYKGENPSICMSPRQGLNSSQLHITSIDNETLFTQLQSPALKGIDGLSCLCIENDQFSLDPLLDCQYDFVFVPPQVWLALQHWYGGSPEIFVNVNPPSRIPRSNCSFGLMELNSESFLPASLGTKNIDLQSSLDSMNNIPIRHFCNVCREVGPLKCSKCKTIYYCSSNCQASDWPFHKLKCQKFDAAHTAETAEVASTSTNGFLSDWTKKLSGMGQSHRSLSLTKRPQCRGLIGLANLGNSCYLNATLQCLAHTFPLVTYFISSRYQKDINTTSPDSTKGKFVNEFAALVKEMWLKPYPSSVLQPIPFRRMLGRLNADYSTFQQQDAHDVLVYLLDRLHEDVNKVPKKPYVENSEGNGENDEKISQESWEKHKMRENSCIQEIFGCQLRSQLICPAQNCQKKSVSFEFASTIQLAIPNRNRDRDRTRSNSAGLFQYKDPAAGTNILNIPILFIPEIPTKIRGTYEPYGLSILSDFLEYPLEVTIEEDSLALVNTLRDSLQKQLLKCVQKCITKKAHEDGVAPPPAITGQRRIFEKGELILIELEEAPEGPNSDSSHPCGWTTASSILNPNNRLNSVFGNSMRRNSAGERMKREVGMSESVHIAAYWRSTSLGLPNNAFLLQRKIFSSSDRAIDASFVLLGRPILISFDSKWSCARLRFTVWKQICHLFRVHREAFGLKVDERDEDLPKQMRMANRLVIRVVDKVGRPIEKNWRESHPNVELPASNTDIEVTENEWAASLGLPTLDLNDSSLLPPLRNVTIAEFLNDGPEEISFLSIDWVDGWNSIIDESLCFAYKCLTNEGFIIDPTPPPTNIPPTSSTSATATQPLVPNTSQPPPREIPQGVISLEECLSLFTSEEILDEDNSWYCSTCKTHRQANKMLQLWKLPKVLIIGLKRFETTNPMRQYGSMITTTAATSHREKITTYVDFPINGLNISSYCNHARRKGSEGAYHDHEYLYDLYGVINHYGRMGFGHYTAFVRDWDKPLDTTTSTGGTGTGLESELSSTWYSFDDDLIHLVDEKTIKTSAAYILFYRQREK